MGLERKGEDHATPECASGSPEAPVGKMRIVHGPILPAWMARDESEVFPVCVRAGSAGRSGALPQPKRSAPTAVGGYGSFQPGDREAGEADLLIGLPAGPFVKTANRL